jgi:hypothetical protein
MIEHISVQVEQMRMQPQLLFMRMLATSMLKRPLSLK